MQFQILASEACLDFVNTLDDRVKPGHETELLESYSALLEWAAQAGLISARQRRALSTLEKSNPAQTQLVFRSGIQLRECLYRIFQPIASGKSPSSADVALLGAYLASSYAHLRLRPDNGTFRFDWGETAQRLDSVLWPIVKSATELLTSEDLKLVRQCDVSDCRWFFVDRSKNHSRRWCDMKVCGNRVKARKFYGRKTSREALSGKANRAAPLPRNRGE
jgi:predicted RNA-binding Zn ribbon-like protein